MDDLDLDSDDENNHLYSMLQNKISKDTKYFGSATKKPPRISDQEFSDLDLNDLEDDSKDKNVFYDMIKQFDSLQI